VCDGGFYECISGLFGGTSELADCVAINGVPRGSPGAVPKGPASKAKRSA
jgi:hypothetical protein